jgi:hypothetical protein
MTCSFFGNFSRFSVPRVVFPQPGLRCEVFTKPFLQGKRHSITIYWDWGRASRVNANPDNTFSMKAPLSSCGFHGLAH